MASPRRARDLALVDGLDALPRQPFAGEVWRVTRAGREPISPSRSRGRWSDGSFDVLYTSLTRDGAIAEIHALLSLQPVAPSRDPWFVHRLRPRAERVLDLSDKARLGGLGVDLARYEGRDYRMTQAIGEAAFFLDADGILVPSARWPCVNFVAFSERFASDALELRESDAGAIDWPQWRNRART